MHLFSRFFHYFKRSSEAIHPNPSNYDSSSQSHVAIKKTSQFFRFAIISTLATLTIVGIPSVYTLLPKTSSHSSFSNQESKAVLAATTSNSSVQLLGTVQFNLPAEFKDKVTVKGLTVNGEATLNGPVTIQGNSLDLGNGQVKASNILYGVKAGTGLSLTTGQTPTITNTGVTSLQGQTGDITLTAGSGLSVSGTTLTNTDPGSSQKIFGKVSDGTNSLTAGNNTDKLTFLGGTGVTVSLDTTNNKFTFSTTGGSGGLSGLTTNGVLYATSATTATTVGPGTSGTLLQANGTNNAPSWVSALTLSGLTVNGAATATTINGLTLTANGTGFSIAGGTTSKTLTLNNTLTFAAGADGQTFTLPATGGTVTVLGNTTTGNGSLVLATSPTLTNPNIGAATATTVNGLSLTANATGFSVAGGTTSKTITLNNTMTLAAGADGQTFTFPATSGTVCISGQTCGSSGTVGYWQRTTSGAYTSLAPSTITDTLSIGQTTGLTAAGLSVKVNALGNAAAYVENTGLGDLFTASAAGATKFVINNSGNVGIGTNNPSNFSLQLAGNIGPNATDTYNIGSTTAEWNNLYVKNIVSPSLGGTSGYWQLNSGVLSPTNITNDFAVGGTSTSSATFQIFNNGSATASGNLTLAGASPTIGTVNQNTLVLGTSTTGAIALNPNNTTGLFVNNQGSVGIGTTTPTTTLDIAGDTRIFNTTSQYGSIYSNTTFLDRTWNTTATFNTAGTTFTSGMQNPAVSNRLNINPNGLIGWTYKRPVTINNTGNSSTLTNYVATFTVDTATPIAAAKMNSNCSDLRFTDTDTVTQLNFWISSGCNTSTTTVYVKIPSIPASSNYTIYEYYGNSSATSGSNGRNTFPIFEDMTVTPAGTLHGVATYDSVNQYVTFNTTNGQNGQLDYTYNPGSGFESNYQFYTSGGADAQYWYAYATATQVGAGNATGGYNGEYNEWTAKINVNYGSTNIATLSQGGINNGAWRTAKILHYGTVIQSYLDGTQKTNTTDSVRDQSGNVFGYGGWSGGTGSVHRIRNIYTRPYSNPDPTASVGAEGSFVYSTGLQSWKSETQDAGSGNTYKPNYLTVNYTLDGSDNIIPKFQILASNTGAFSGEETIYPNGTGTFYQNGGTYSITSGTQLNITSQVTTGYRYWKVKAYMDTGANTSDTPTVTNIRLQDSRPLILQAAAAGPSVGIGTTTPGAKLDINGNLNVSTYATISASLALGNLSAPNGVGNLVLSGNLGIGTSNPLALFDANSLFDVFSTGKIGINNTSPLGMLDIKSSLGTLPIASLSGQTSFAGLVVDNKGVGDLFTASTSGLTRFVVTQSGNVGIGTSTPGGPLEVKYATANTSGTAADLILNNPSTGTQTIQYFQINGVNKSELRSDNVGDLVVEAGNGGHLFLGYNDLTTADTYINSNGGNVGIGTTTVNASLDFGSATATNKIYLFDNGSDKYGMGVNNSGLQLYAGAGTSTNNVQFGRFDGTTFTEMARIQSNGLGLGTTTLTAALDVRANSGTTAIASASGSTAFAAQVVNNNGVGDLFTASSSGVTKFTIANNGNITSNANTTINGTFNVSTYATISASLALGNINAPSGVGNLALSGSLGIGTTTLTQALTVAGNASIYNSANGRGDIFSTANLDKTWNTAALFNTAGTTFSAGMQNPAIGNQLNLKSTLGLAGWQRRKAVTVNNTGNGNTLTNYQVQITTDTATLIAAGKMNSDCSDVRVTDSDGSTTLNYWIESGCNTGSTIIWTKIPSITASSNYTIYLYYGNSGATSLSSTNTFIRDVSGVSLAYRFDEASGSTTTDYSGNANTGTYTGTSVVAGQFNNARNFTGNSDVVVTSSNVTLGTSWTEAAWINFPIPATSGGWRSVFVKAGGIYHTLIFDSSGNLGTYPSFWASSGYNTNSLSGWHHIMEVGTGGTSSFYVDGTVVGTASAQAQNQSVGNIGNVTTAQQQQIGKLDEPRIYSVALTQAQITDIAANYGYVTPNYAGHELVRKFSSPEPSTSLGSEVSTYTSGLQSWTSETQDAGSGNVYKPNFLTVNYTLDGSDNIHPKFQILGSNTGSFSGEETVYPNGVGTFYQNGTTYSITSGTQLDVSSQITSKFRYWRVKGYMDTGATVSDTPLITSIRLQDYQSNLSLFANGNVGIGNTNAAFKLDVQDTQSATVAAMVRNINTGTTASGLGIAVGATNPGTSNYFLSFLDGAGRIIGKIQGNGSGGVTYATTGIDFAEYYKKAVKAEPLTAGTVVCLSPNGATTCNTGGNILGVVSDRAGFAGGAEHADDPNYVLVGLVGQLPVKVATTSGTIIAGDPITASTNGIAVKATTAGQIIGHALTSSQDTTDGTIMVSVNASWYDPHFYTSATTGVLGTSAQALTDSTLLTANTATISGTLNVLGRTTATDLGVTGNISAGLLTIDGLNNTINTLAGDLKLQSEGLGGVDILHGKVTIDTSGNITTQGVIAAETVQAIQFVVKGSTTIGSATIPHGYTSVEVDTPAMTTADKVFITPTTNVDVPLTLAQKATGKFVIKVSTPQNVDINFDWFIVKNKL